jgi:hypothetical protein
MYACKPAWIVAMGNGLPVLRGRLGWSLVRIASHRRQPSCFALSIAAPRQRAPYPILTYPALPCCPPLSFCLCFSPVCL